MLRFYGSAEPAAALADLRPGGLCPHCGHAARFQLVSLPDGSTIQREKVQHVVLSYYCEFCLSAIPIRWHVYGWNDRGICVDNPEVLTRIREPFDFEHVPDEVKREIEESLDCLSVNAYHGFAVCCRRAVQAICPILGAAASSKVKAQIEEMAELQGLPEEVRELAIQVMLSGHDGAHPNLPEVTPARALILVKMLQDLTGQLFTRPGRLRAATELRRQIISDGSA